MVTYFYDLNREQGQVSAIQMPVVVTLYITNTALFHLVF